MTKFLGGLSMSYKLCIFVLVMLVQLRSILAKLDSPSKQILWDLSSCYMYCLVSSEVTVLHSATMGDYSNKKPLSFPILSEHLEDTLNSMKKYCNMSSKTIYFSNIWGLFLKFSSMWIYLSFRSERLKLSWIFSLHCFNFPNNPKNDFFSGQRALEMLKWWPMFPIW